MFKNSKFQKFFEYYKTIESEEESLKTLKDFMFSLTSEEIQIFMLETAKSHNKAVSQIIANPNIHDVEKQAFSEQFKTLLNVFSSKTTSTQTP
jgi:hypothetical protein